jgi:clan AA aspartic protease (TIGR02281 family)
MRIFKRTYKTLLAGILILLSVEGYSMNKNYSEQLDIIESIMERYFRVGPGTHTIEKLNSAIDSYNNLVEMSNETRRKESEKLQKEKLPLDEMDAKIDKMYKELNSKPMLTDQKAVENHNEKVKQYNGLIEKRKVLLQEYNSKVDVYNRSIEIQNAGIEKNKAELQELKIKTNSFIEEENEWVNSKKDIEFSRSVNGLYAEISAELRSLPRDSKLQRDLARARSFRRELFEFTKKKNIENPEGGVIVLPGVIIGEEIYFLLDTGANSVTITPEIVRALGYENLVGEETEHSIAGGYTAKGRRITLPELSVAGFKSQNVNAAVLNESSVGIDGLLGISFLKDYKIMIDFNAENKVKFSR